MAIGFNMPCWELRHYTFRCLFLPNCFSMLSLGFGGISIETVVPVSFFTNVSLKKICRMATILPHLLLCSFAWFGGVHPNRTLPVYSGNYSNNILEASNVLCYRCRHLHLVGNMKAPYQWQMYLSCSKIRMWMKDHFHWHAKRGRGVNVIYNKNYASQSTMSYTSYSSH